MPNYTVLANELASSPDWKLVVIITGNQLLRCPVCKALIMVEDKVEHSRWHVEQEPH